jgi:hypothetical protein
MRLPTTLSSTIDKVARSALGNDWGLYAALIERWPEIVGPDYAQETAPVKISFPKGKKTDEKWASGRRGGGTLTISLPQGLSFSFSHQTGLILSRINNFFGYQAIDRITLKPFYPKQGKTALPDLPPLSQEEKDSLKTSTESIDNDELKAALEQLGASVLANQKRF